MKHDDEDQDALMELRAQEMAPDSKAELLKFVQSVAPLVSGLVATMASIPYLASAGAVFGGMAALLATQGQRAKYQRLIDLVERVKDEVEAVGAEKLDENFVGSEEHLDLIRETFHASAQARDDLRVDWYAKILVGAASREDRSSSRSRPGKLSWLPQSGSNSGTTKEVSC